jgi:hypothetical protein
MNSLFLSFNIDVFDARRIRFDDVDDGDERISTNDTRTNETFPIEHILQR